MSQFSLTGMYWLTTIQNLSILASGFVDGFKAPFILEFHESLRELHIGKNVGYEYSKFHSNERNLFGFPVEMMK